jgi:hypothetical protein
MAQTLKKKNITRYIKIQVAHDKKNPRSSKTDQHFQKKQKFNKKNSFFSHKIKNHKLFSKLIGLLNNKCKFESRLKPNPIKFPVKIFLKNMPLRLMNQIHENREGSQNFSAKPVKSLSKKINRYQKKLKLLRQENKSKLSSFFYTP